jgi:hypothetical protein
MRTQNWTIKVDNITYKIEYSTKLFKKKLLVNTIPIKLEPSKTFGVTRETAFYLGNKRAIFVSVDNNCDISIDGLYIGSGEKYIEIKNMPKWNFIFLVLVSFIFIFSYDSICSALFTLTGFYFLIRSSIEPSLDKKQRIILCSMITLSSHLFFWLVLFPLILIL